MPTWQPTTTIVFPQVPDTEVHFFTEKYFKGSKYRYRLGDDVDLSPTRISDAFSSVASGEYARLLAWDAQGLWEYIYGPRGYKTLTSERLESLTRFHMLGVHEEFVAFKFLDGTAASSSSDNDDEGEEGTQRRKISSPDRYKLQVTTTRLGEKILRSEPLGDQESSSDEEDAVADYIAFKYAVGFRLVGLLDGRMPPITATVQLRDAQTCLLLPPAGSVTFQWNDQEQRVDAVPGDDFPKQLTLRREVKAENGVGSRNGARFIVTLVDPVVEQGYETDLSP